jgi:hypothetical protein
LNCKSVTACDPARTVRSAQSGDVNIFLIALVYVIGWDDGQLSEVSPDDSPDLETRLQLWPKQGLKTT